MKYVDEFRDPDKAQIAGRRRSDALVPTRIARDQARPLHIMEVCGGHTHAIFRYGIETMLPDGDRVGARPGLSGLRAADGTRRRLRGPRRAARA